MVLTLDQHTVETLPIDHPWLPTAAVSAIRSVPHFSASHYRTWNPDDLLASYTHSFVKPLQRLRIIDDTTTV